jgi:hypothetical protein
MITDQLREAVDQLLGRASGPMHFRLIMQPLMATFLAFKAGRADAAAGRPAFLWEFFRNPTERGRLLGSAWKDLSKILLVAVLLDTIYQIIVLKEFHPLQTLIVAFVLAVLPYTLFRGPFARLFRARGRKDAA